MCCYWVELAVAWSQQSQFSHPERRLRCTESTPPEKRCCSKRVFLPTTPVIHAAFGYTPTLGEGMRFYNKHKVTFYIQQIEISFELNFHCIHRAKATVICTVAKQTFLFLHCVKTRRNSTSSFASWQFFHLQPQKVTNATRSFFSKCKLTATYQRRRETG